MIDFLADVFRSLRRRPLRVVLTGFGVAVGVGSFVGTVGISSSGATAVARSFDALKASEATYVIDDVGDPEELSRLIAQRLTTFPEVQAAGLLVENIAGSPTQAVTRVPGGPAATSLPVHGADLAYLQAVQASVWPGTGNFASASFLGRPAEALIGRAALAQMGTSAPPLGGRLIVGGVPLRFSGVIEQSARDPRLLSAIVVPMSVGLGLWPTDSVQLQGYTRTTVGASAMVARYLASSLLPERPGSVAAGASSDVDTLRTKVVTQVDALALGLGGISLAVSAVGILNALLVSVFERKPELGLRRCLGATRFDIAALVGAEAVVISMLGALVGSGLGVAVAVIASSIRDWPVVVPPFTIPVGLLAGAGAGLLGGVYPALRSSRTSPMAAARS